MRLLTQHVARCVLQLAGTLLAAAGPVPDASAGPVPDASAGPVPDASADPAPVAAAESSRESRSTELVQTLRRQLMRDNSDYSLEAPAAAARGGADCELGADDHHVTKVSPAGAAGRERHFDNATERNGNKTKHELPVSKRDLLYYVDDDQLVAQTPDKRKYTMLKVRRQFRRSGQDAFIQEEGAEGVAIVSLGKAPFPELRLPRARRQYGRARGAAAARERELRPPAAARRCSDTTLTTAAHNLPYHQH